MEESGYPPLDDRGQTERVANVPSAVVHKLLQVKAREHVFSYALQMVGWEQMTSDVVFNSRFYNAETRAHHQYCTLIRLNDDQLPYHAAHFRAAAMGGALGHYVHQCFVPPGQSAAELPFVTLYHHSSRVPCATKPLTLPDDDIVYDDYAKVVADAGATYPVGTVLMYPRAVAPEWGKGFASNKSPLFIVFKLCSVKLLRGAVPVGRVVSCVPGYSPEPSDTGAPPFDDVVTRCFKNHCMTKKCSVFETGKVSYMDFSSFIPT